MTLSAASAANRAWSRARCAASSSTRGAETCLEALQGQALGFFGFGYRPAGRKELQARFFGPQFRFFHGQQSPADRFRPAALHRAGQSSGAGACSAAPQPVERFPVHPGRNAPGLSFVTEGGTAVVQSMGCGQGGAGQPVRPAPPVGQFGLFGLPGRGLQVDPL